MNNKKVLIIIKDFYIPAKVYYPFNRGITTDKSDKPSTKKACLEAMAIAKGSALNLQEKKLPLLSPRS